MKTALVVCGPDVPNGPLALLSGTFEEKAKQASRLGYDGIELMVRDPANLDWPAVKATLMAVGLEVAQLVTGELFGADGLCLVTPDRNLFYRTEERMRSVIDLAAYLGAMVNIGRVRGRLDWLGSVPDAWAVAVERLHGIVEFADTRGVKITLEPINRYESDFIPTVADGLRMIEDLGTKNVGLVLDMFHMNIEENSIEESIQLAQHRLWHVHIADSNRRYPGSGHLDFDMILRALTGIGFQGYVSAEMLPFPDPNTAAEKTIRFFDKWLVGQTDHFAHI
jgi:5-keto-L-gluconate epimerase